MCGIYGAFNRLGEDVSADLMTDMSKVITYRGPDGSGFHIDDSVGIGNNRLAILDLEQGEQPFVSDDGMIAVVQNGEIFNHVELADELEGTEFSCSTHCDTEVILRLYEKMGIDFVSKLNGMFAIAIWDAKLQSLFLIRDRVGEKPLYYSDNGDNVLFGSEIKSILASKKEYEVSKTALDCFLALNYVPQPMTMFEGISHVEPGSYVEFTRSGSNKVNWWDLTAISTDLSKTEEQWMNEFNAVLDDATRIRLRSDVPFGAFLSGGVDSSSVVGLMSQHMSEPVKTFSIGFDDPKYDESPYALEAAERFSTEHINEKVSPNLLSYWPKVIHHCDQPHGDVSFMPTYRVAELASKSVKMVLTGDGADELFAGYDKYKTFFSDSEIFKVSREEFEELYKANITLFSKTDRDNLYHEEFLNEFNVGSEDSVIESAFEEAASMDRINQALYIDTKLLLSGNNLVKPDRMGMAVSIENRAPFLDYRMIELAFSIPGSLKLSSGETKYIYKKAVSSLIGENLAYRKKQMFTVPIGEWLKSDLKELVFDLILSDRFRARKLFDSEYVSTLYMDHCSGVKNNTREIRALMALELWFRELID